MKNKVKIKRKSTWQLMRIYSAFNFRRLRYTLGVPSIEVILKLNFHVQSRKIDGVDGYEVI